jgi:AcrR family transcriptional regulator
MTASHTYHHGDLRTACVEAGLALVQDGGQDALTIRGVARLTGVSHTAPLHHFRDRDQLVAAVAQVGFDRLIERTRGHLAADPGMTGIARLRTLGIDYIEQAISEPGLFHLMFSDAACDTGIEAYELLQELIKASSLGSRETDRMALLFWAQVHGLAGLYSEGKLAHELVGLAPGRIPARAEQALDDLIAAIGQPTTRRTR